MEKASHLENYLILIQLAIAVFLLSFVLEGNDNETDEDVDHKEGDNNDVDEVENGNHRSIVVQGAHILRVRIDRDVEQSATSLGLISAKSA